MDWKDIAGIVGNAAPILGTLVGGPAGAAVGGLIASALGTSNTPDAIKNAIATDPQAALKLATYESDNKVKLQEMTYAHAAAVMANQTAVIQADVADRVSARKSSVEGGTSKHLFWLSVVLLCFTLGCEIAVLFVGLPHTVPELIVGRVLGLLDSVALMVLAFWYGSSSSSNRKDGLLAQSTPAETK